MLSHRHRHLALAFSFLAISSAAEKAKWTWPKEESEEKSDFGSLLLSIGPRQQGQQEEFAHRTGPQQGLREGKQLSSFADIFGLSEVSEKSQ